MTVMRTENRNDDALAIPRVKKAESLKQQLMKIIRKRRRLKRLEDQLSHATQVDQLGKRF